MKKQILFFVFLVMALIAGVNKSYSQCADDALHPMAGKPYHYIISAAGGGTVKSYEWIVTTSTDIVSSGTFASTTTGFTMVDGDKADCTITWDPATIAAALSATPTQYYVAVKVVSTNSENCDVDNVKVYQIDPVNKFQIDLANWTASGTAGSGNNCTSTVVDAKITAGTPGTVTYDYGTSSVYVKVTTRNFSGSWDMTVDNNIVANLGGDETANLYWSNTIGGTETAVTPGTAINIPEQTSTADDDEVIYLRLEVDHNTWEGLGAEDFVFAVNGTDAGGLPDVSATCAPEADAVTQKILERPTITNGTTGSGTNTTYLIP